MPGQYWSLNTAGGYFANPRLTMKLHGQAQPLMRFRAFTNKDEDFGKGRGDTLLFDKVFNVDTGGGRLTENVPVPQTAFKVQQGSVVAVELGNSIPFSEKLETLSEFDLSDPIQSRLVDDMAKTVNAEAKAQFVATNVKYAATGSVGSPTATWGVAGVSTAFTRAIQTFDVKEIIDAMKSGVYGATTIVPVPPWDGENYTWIGSVGACRAIKDDPDWEDAAKYGDPERLFAGEIGRYYGCRFIEENHLLTNTTGGYRGEAVIFGKEAVKEIVVVPEEIRRGIPMDLGRDRRMGWYAILGFKIIWSYTAVTEVENRIVHVVSA